MKIAYFTDTYFPQINGVTNTLSKLTEYLDGREDIEYKIFSPDFGDNGTPDHKVERFYSFKFFFYPECRLSIPNIFRLNDTLKDFKPDIIHSVTEINMGLTGMRYAVQNKIPLISTFTTNFPEYMKYYNLPYLYETSWKIMRKIHNQSDICMCPSRETQSLLRKQGIRNVGLWGRGIDFNRFKPAENKTGLKEKFGMKDKLMILYVGRISNEKNISILISSYRHLKNIYSDLIGLTVVGDGPLLEELKKGNEDINFTGYLKGQELADAYRAADIFAFPSTTETLGNVVLEAMASGVPVVGPSSGGLKDNIHHMYNGILSVPNDTVTFQDAIASLIEDSELRESLGSNAREYASTKSWNSIFDQLIDDYHTIIENKADRKITGAA